jgi:hypothetical protein
VVTSHESNSKEPSAARRLSDLRRDLPGDATLENLLEVVRAKRELCARLPVFEYEADTQGHQTCVDAFRRLAAMERESFREILLCLRRHIDVTIDGRDAAGGA